MKRCENLYFFRNNPQFVKRHLGDFLLFQIYSPAILRESYRRWPELPDFLRAGTPSEIVNLMNKSYRFSDRKLNEKLNRYLIDDAIRVLKSYQNCGVPLTQDPTVKQTRRKLTSLKGDRNLKKLQLAVQKKDYSDEMADLAVCCAHKFLFDAKNYRSWKITPAMAEFLTQKHGNGDFTFPAIQLTKGCENNCSHCCERATAHLSHMPWPVFVNLYRSFYKHYRHYSQKKCDCFFAKFFSDSDMLSYHDHIMDTDAGDVGLWLMDEDGICQYLTRGVTSDRSKLALTKAILSRQPIAISFVDTPKENMSRNIRQLNDTLDVFESIPGREYNPTILHLHMKSGVSVPDIIFRDFPVEKKGIWAIGRGKDLPDDETEHYPDNEFFAPDIISPNGDILMCRVKDGEDIKEKIGRLYGVHRYRPKTSLCKRLVRLFKRQR